jgi:YggT family protein
MTENKVSEVQTTQREPERERRIFSFKATQVIWLFLGILEVMLLLRFALKLIAANPDSPIAAFIYGFTGLFLLPFVGLTAAPAVGGMVLEIGTIIAMAVYALVGWAIERVVWLIFYRPRGPVVSTTQTSSSEDHINHTI